MHREGDRLVLVQSHVERGVDQVDRPLADLQFDRVELAHLPDQREPHLDPLAHPLHRELQVVGDRQDQRLGDPQTEPFVGQVGDPARHPDVLQRHVGEELGQSLVGIRGEEDLLDLIGVQGVAGTAPVPEPRPSATISWRLSSVARTALLLMTRFTRIDIALLLSSS